jgi:hypothetical protein
MNAIQIDPTMTATTTTVNEMKDAPRDEWSYELFLLKSGAD